MDRNNPFDLLVDDHHGQYIGQVFAACVKRECFPTITQEEWSILESGPDHESYFDVSNELDQHTSTYGANLWWCEGSLWLVDWTLIGNEEEIYSLGEIAYDAFKENASAWNLYCELRAALYDGPDAGRWDDELLGALRDTVREICRAIESDLPLYWNTDYGIEEKSIDVESLLLEEAPGLKELAAYW